MSKVLVLTLALALSSLILAQEDSGFAPGKPRCHCQCDPYVFSDGSGTHGNCISADEKGRYWCFIKGRSLRACTDIRYKNGRPISNEACATPPRDSPQCNN